MSALEGSLDHRPAGPASKNLAALYTWLSLELVQVNVRGDLARLRACQAVVEPLRESWREALETTAATSHDSRLVG